MKPVVSIIMGSTSDLPVMEKAAKFFDEMEIPFEMNALVGPSDTGRGGGFCQRGCRTRPESNYCGSGDGSGFAGCDSGQYDVARHRGAYQGDVGRFGCHAFHYSDASRHTGGYGGSQRSAECRHSGRTVLSLADEGLALRLAGYKENLKQKIVKANTELADVKYKFKCN